MKVQVFSLAAVLVLSVSLRAQNSLPSKCGTMHYLLEQKKDDPGLEGRMHQQEEQLQKWIRENADNRNVNKKSTMVIPVVVHIIYSADSQNISDQRVFDQIAAINRSFAGQSLQSMQAFPDSMKVNTEIQFCLASIKPDGSATNGIERRETGVAGFQNNAVKYFNFGGMDAWDPTKYFNIWVCNYNYSDGTSYVFSAYAQFPGTGINETYGVVIRYGAFGLNDSTYYRGKGGILSHEIGHCLNLRHIWGDDGTDCSGSDYCDDTPNQAGRTEGINSGVLTDNCTSTSPGIMYMNYMDYSDDVIYANFTPDQKIRMHANFLAPNGTLLSLANSEVCSLQASISEYRISKNLTIFPNPASSILVIEVEPKILGTTCIIYDLYGKEVLRTTLTSIETRLSLHNLAMGIYYFQLEGFVETYKVIKR